MNGRQLCEERSLTGRHCVYPVSQFTVNLNLLPYNPLHSSSVITIILYFALLLIIILLFFYLIQLLPVVSHLSQ